MEPPEIGWEKTFGGNNYDEGYSVQQTNDGGYIIGGTIRLSEFNSDMYLLKLDSNGNEIWNKQLEGVVMNMHIMPNKLKMEDI